MVRRSNVTRPEFANLAGALYAAAAAPELWPTALDAVGDALGGAALVTSFHRPTGMAFGVSNRLDLEAEATLRTHYASIESNPLMAAMPQIPVLAAVARESVMEDHSYLRSGLFNDVFRAQGFVHAGLSCLAREDGVFMPCGVLRRKNREFDTECFRLYEAILPHLRRAMELTVRFSDLRAARRHVEAIANAGEHGYIVTDASARVLYANAAAEHVLSVRGGLSCRGGILTATRQDETARLHHLISSAAHGSGHLGGNMRITRAPSVMPWALVVMPAPEAFAETARTGIVEGNASALALVRLIDLERRVAAPAGRLMAFFGISKAEALVAMGLMEGLRPEQIAEHRHLRITTVRTHIRSIYFKTGTTRQAELVRLLLRAAGPPENAG